MNTETHNQKHLTDLDIRDYKKGFIKTMTGVLIDLKNPVPENFNTVDICIGLTNTCRFGGQLHTHYGVDKHTLLVHHLAPEDLKQVALLRDASEAYLGDVIKPVKHILGKVYADIEESFTRAIFKKYGVNYADLDKIKPYDDHALILEDDYFRNNEGGLLTQKFREMKNPLALFDATKSHRMLWNLLYKTFVNV